jgi:hypothetical protein
MPAAFPGGCRTFPGYSIRPSEIAEALADAGIHPLALPCVGHVYCAYALPSVVFFLRMKLTTPAIASDPYTAVAPSSRISTRSTASSGIELMFTAKPPPLEFDSAATGGRMPSISTSVYFDGKACSDAVATPPPPPFTEAEFATKFCTWGRLWISSVALVAPLCSM